MLSLYLTAGRGVSPGDESWFLFVAKRVADGDHLFQNVFYAPLPLAIWVTAVPVALFGPHILIVEVLTALTWAGTALLVATHARRVSGNNVAAVLAVMALVVVAPPQRNSLYTPLAMLLLLTCMVLTARLVENVSDRLALAAGAAAALSFASKQNIGAAALAALLLSVLCVLRRRRARTALAALGGFALVSLALVVALALSGELDDAVRAGFTDRGKYLAHGSQSYPHALSAAFEWLPSQPTAAFDALPPLLAPLVAVVLVAAGWRRAIATPALVPVTFAVAALAGTYPRFSATHLAWANPAVIACAVALVGPGLRLRSRLTVGLAVPLAVGCASAASLGLLPWLNGELVVSSLPAFQGAPLARTSENATVRMRYAIPPGTAVFFVTEQAGFFYLVTGARDPTPYDIPATTNIGPSDVASIVARVRDGTIRRACIGGPAGYPGEPSLRPLALERALRHVMRRGPELGPCVLYRS